MHTEPTLNNDIWRLIFQYALNCAAAVQGGSEPVYNGRVVNVDTLTLASVRRVCKALQAYVDGVFVLPTVPVLKRMIEVHDVLKPIYKNAYDREVYLKNDLSKSEGLLLEKDPELIRAYSNREIPNFMECPEALPTYPFCDSLHYKKGAEMESWSFNPCVIQWHDCLLVPSKYLPIFNLITKNIVTPLNKITQDERDILFSYTLMLEWYVEVNPLCEGNIQYLKYRQLFLPMRYVFKLLNLPIELKPDETEKMNYRWIPIIREIIITSTKELNKYKEFLMSCKFEDRPIVSYQTPNLEKTEKLIKDLEEFTKSYVKVFQALADKYDRNTEFLYQTRH